jgi:hypothetical protein
LPGLPPLAARRAGELQWLTKTNLRCLNAESLSGTLGGTRKASSSKPERNKGVRCWFAPHDLPIGGKILDEIDAAIRLRDKVMLILSEHSIKSDWVEDEVTKAFEEERKRSGVVLFPIRLDDAVMDTNEAWAAKLRARNIGDFCKWKHHDAYQTSLERVLRDLNVPK